MKSIFVRFTTLVTIGLVMASCNNEEANKKAQEADEAAIQALVDAKAQAIDEEVSAACDAKVLQAAQDTVAALAASASKTPTKAPVAAKPKAKPAPAKPAPVKEEPKKGFGGAVQNSGNETKGFGGQIKEEKQEGPKKKGFGGQIN